MAALICVDKAAKFQFMRSVSFSVRQNEKLCIKFYSDLQLCVTEKRSCAHFSPNKTRPRIPGSQAFGFAATVDSNDRQKTMILESTVLCWIWTIIFDKYGIWWFLGHLIPLLIVNFGPRINLLPGFLWNILPSPLPYWERYHCLLLVSLSPPRPASKMFIPFSKHAQPQPTRIRLCGIPFSTIW